MIFIIFILSTILFAFILTKYVNKKQKVRRRIQQLTKVEINTVEADSKAEGPMTSPIKKILSILSKSIKTTETKRIKIESELEGAGIPLKVEEFITIRLVMFTIAFFFSFFFGFHLLVALLCAVLGWNLPSFYIRRKKQSRLNAFTAQLPDALETMASAIKSGFSFMQAMQLVSKEMDPPIGIEFARTNKEINLGISMETAFGNLLKRMPNKDLEIVVTAVLIQRSTGGNLVQMLETIHATISERVRMKDELKALTSQGRMSATVISLLPVALGGILYLMDRSYFNPMLSHPIGVVLISAGIISGVIGWLLINKIVKVEV
ncbi:type II secretion system F family protein [Bacillus tuaregi]|uniref:type II secretion system F family protein n=1 Tax=Bacillus tuaregi TaxID=1816695 RepID=UPI000A041F72|nr:type II secretion system F family protein [Bacillus tuaregi]